MEYFYGQIKTRHGSINRLIKAESKDQAKALLYLYAKTRDYNVIDVTVIDTLTTELLEH